MAYQRVRPLLLLLILLMVIPGVTAQETARDPGTLIVANIIGPRTLDPASAYDTASGEAIFNIYEPLIFYNRDKTDEFIPLLVTDWRISEDGLTYTFTIREGVRFHNGDLLTPEDVEYSFERAMIHDPEGGPIWMLLEPLVGVDSIDDLAQKVGDYSACSRVKAAVEVRGHDVIFHLVTPFAPFLSILAGTWASIVDKGWVIQQGGWSGSCSDWRKYHEQATKDSVLYDRTNGTGPFKLESWESGKEVVFARNDSYWRKPAKLKKVIIKQVEGWGTRKSMLLNGDADIVDVPRQHAKELEGVEGIRVYKDLPTMQLDAIFFNQAISTSGGNSYIGTGRLDGNGIPTDFFSDVNVRKAFNYAFDWDAYIRDAWLGEAEQARGPIPKTVFGYNPSQTTYSYNPALAKEYFKKAWSGQVWERGFRFTILYNSGNDARRIAAEILKKNIEAMNSKFHIDIKALDWSAYLNSMVNRKLPLFLIGWLEDYHDPHNWVYPFMHSHGAFSAFQGIDNPHYDQLIEDGVKTTDLSKRREIYYELQRLAYQDAIDIFLVQPLGRHYEREWVQGWYYNPIYPGTYFYPLSKELPNQRPQARFSYSPSQPTDLDIIQFTDESTDLDGRIVKWYWDFGDGHESSEQNPTHQYKDNRTYTVTLIVTDDDGAIGTNNKMITVANVPPQAQFTYSPATPLAGQPVTFNASASSDPDGHIVLYEWDFGDGSVKNYGMIVTHVFAKEGTYTVKLTVTDDDGASPSTKQEMKVLESGGGGGPA